MTAHRPARPGVADFADVTQVTMLLQAPTAALLANLRALSPKKRRGKVRWVLTFALVAMLAVLGRDAMVREYVQSTSAWARWAPSALQAPPAAQALAQPSEATESAAPAEAQAEAAASLAVVQRVIDLPPQIIVADAEPTPSAPASKRASSPKRRTRRASSDR